MSQVKLQTFRVDQSQEPLLRLLLGYYCHDMAEYFQIDTNEDGTYSYPIGELWEAGCDVHIAYLDRIPIGFAVVGSADAYVERKGTKDLREFFVLRRHRRSGVGSLMATMVWEEYPGHWLVRALRRNAAALPFWSRVLHTHTDGQFQQEVRTVSDREWSYFSFSKP
jgi:predicted acetyltransferase